MSKVFLLAMSCLFGVLSTAQSEFNLSAHFGVGKMSNSQENDWHNMQTELKTRLSFSTDISANYRYSFDYIFLQSGISFSYISGKQQESLPVISVPSMNEAEIISEKKLSVYYLGIPITGNFKWNQFDVGVGIKPNFRLTNSFDSKTYSTNPTDGINQAVNSYSYSGGNNMRRTDLGLIGRAGYDVNDWISIELSGYWGLLDVGNNFDQGVLYDIMQDPQLSESRTQKNRQLLVGLKFRLNN